MASGERVSGPAIGSIAIGGLLVVAGVKGWSLSVTIQDLIRGTNPKSQPQATPISGGSATTPLPGGITAAGGGNTGLPGGTAGGVYTHGQLQTLWMLAGGNPSGANNAACHAIQESSGNPLATSANPDGGINVGLWQLDTKGKGAGYTVAQLQHPLTNARAAVAGSNNGTDWSAWATPGC